MSKPPIGTDETPSEMDFSTGVRGLHHIPPGAKVLMPVSIERGVWEYFSPETEQHVVNLPELMTEVLERDIEISEAMKQNTAGIPLRGDVEFRLGPVIGLKGPRPNPKLLEFPNLSGPAITWGNSRRRQWPVRRWMAVVPHRVKDRF